MAAADPDLEPITWDFSEARKVLNDQYIPVPKDALEDDSSSKLGDFSNIFDFLGTPSGPIHSPSFYGLPPWKFEKFESSDEEEAPTRQPAEEFSNEEGGAEPVLKGSTRQETRKKNIKSPRKTSEALIIVDDNVHRVKAPEKVKALSFQEVASRARSDIIKDILGVISTKKSAPPKQKKKPDHDTGVRFKVEDEGMTSKDEGYKTSTSTGKKKAARGTKSRDNWTSQEDGPEGAIRMHSGYEFENLGHAFAVLTRPQLLDQLQLEFPSDADALRKISDPTQKYTTTSPSQQSGEIFIFVDISNIKICLQDRLKANRGISKHVRIKANSIQFYNLSIILERGRHIGRRCLVGSRPLREAKEAEGCQYECKLLELVEKPAPPSRATGYASGSDQYSSRGRQRQIYKRGEQAVDEVLNMSMLESLIDNKPATLVLASGDAATGEFSDGFLATVERALVKGWKVEVVAFKTHTSGAYFRPDFKKKWAKRFRFINLDPYAELLAAR